MSTEKSEQRKARRLKRRAALRERSPEADYPRYELDKDDAGILLDAIFSYINEHRHEPRMELCEVSRDQGKTWTAELINTAITDPELSTLKAGDMVKSKGDEAVYVMVANEGEYTFVSPFQDDPDSPLFLPEGHLYRYALPYD